jgi:tRNA(Ile)-lysidine synthase TilS/MesJ
MDRSKITLIRPLIYAPEKYIRSFIKKNNIEIMSKVCPMDGFSKREDMKNLLFTLQKDIPHIRANLYGAIQRNLDDWKL